jgi:hypothetical protein
MSALATPTPAANDRRRGNRLPFTMENDARRHRNASAGAKSARGRSGINEKINIARALYYHDKIRR